jgi:hypothetical protein
VDFMKHTIKRLSSLSRKTSMLAVGLVSIVAMLAMASAAMAEPEGEFKVFNQCPTTEAETCLHAVSSGGEFHVGTRTVPLTNPITLQGGFNENPKTEELTFVAAKNGETLSKSPQKVPGGLFGIEGLGGEVYATTELAAPASDIIINETNLIEEKGVALGLPVKVKLENPILGNKCYIGSEKNPIHLELTTGTTNPPKPNKPISGALGEVGLNPTGEILIVKNNELVNNEFAAPGVQGCDLIPPIVDPIVDLDLGLPAAAGHNTVIIKGTLEQTSSAIVKDHEP